MTSAQSDFDQALGAFQAGQSGLAEAFCRKLLTAEPLHADAATLLAVLCCQAGRLEEGIAWAGRALQVRPADAQAWEIKGDALHMLGRFADAVDAFIQAVNAEPRRGMLWAKLGAAQNLTGEAAAAQAAYAQAMALPGLTADVVGDYGLLLAANGQGQAAVDHLAHAVRAGYRTGPVLSCLAGELAALGRDAEAIEVYRQALALAPDAATHLGLGLLLTKADDAAGGLAEFQRAAALDPTQVEARSSASIALYKLQRFAEAAESARQAIALSPHHAKAYTNLGNALVEVGDLDGAMAALRRAIELAPDDGGGYTNLGLALQAAGRDQEAHAALEHGLALSPEAAWCNINLAHMLLAQGQWDRGWAGYAKRHWVNDSQDIRQKLGLPDWTGEALGEGWLLLQAEQGIGDEIMFAGLLPQVLALAPHLVLTCDARLIEPFRRIFPSVRLMAQGRGGALPAGMAAQAYIGDLPGLLRPDRAGPPPWLPAPYLRADPVRRQHLRDGYGERPVIGLAWSSAAARTGRRRSIDWDQLRPLLDLDHVTWVSLQYGAAAQAARGRHPNLIVDDRVDQMTDMDGFIAQLDAMDAVVTIDNSIAHVAGALAKPTVVMLPANSDWRWGRTGTDQNWYPSMTLVRRSFDGDWDAVIRSVVAAVLERFPVSQ